MPKKIILGVLWLLVLAVPIFWHLGYMVIQPWDESLFAIRAYHLLEEGEVLKNFDHYSENIEFTNSKPVFMTYVQSLSCKILGFSEFALRLPTAICTFFLCFCLPFITQRVFKNFTIGILASLVLISSLGLVYFHMGRSANQDIPFVLFLFLFIVHLYFYLNERKLKDALLTVAFFCLAYFTKSIFVFISIPALILIVTIKGELLSYLKDKRIIILLLILFAILGLSMLDSIQHFNNYKRLLQVEKHQGSMHFYLKWMIEDKLFFPWIFIIPLGLIWIRKNRFLQFLFLEIFFILLIISLAKTKLYWYFAPLLPFMAIIVGYVFYQIIKKLKEKFIFLKKWPNVFLVTFCVLVFSSNYLMVLDWIYYPREYKPANKTIVILKQASTVYPQLKKIDLYPSEIHTPQVDFYIYWYNQKKNYQLTRIFNSDSFHSKYVITEEITFDSFYNQKYQNQVLLNYHGCRLIKISGLKGIKE